MLNSKTIDSEHKRLRDYLRILLKSEVVINNLANNTNLQAMIEKGLNVFYFLSQKKGQKSEAERLASEYVELSPNKTFRLSESFSISDDYDLIDEINYMNVFIKNTFNQDITSLKKGIFDSVKKMMGSTTPNFKGTEFANQAKQNQAQSAFNNSFNGTNNNQFAETMNNMYSQENWSRAMAQGMAHQRLNEEIRNGSFYLYKTKPREIVFIKYLMMGFYVLLASLCFVLTGLIAANANFVYSATELNAILGLGWTQQQISTITTNITILNPSMAIFTVFLGLYFSWTFYKLYRTLRISKNENEIYFLNVRNFLFLIIFVIIFFTFLNTSFWGLIFNWTKNAWFTLSNSASEYFTAYGSRAPLYGSIFVTLLVLASIIGVIVFMYVSAIFLNPKVDMEKMNQVISKYVEEFIAGSNFKRNQ